VTESVAKAECTCTECFATLCVSVNILHSITTHKKKLYIQHIFLSYLEYLFTCPKARYDKEYMEE
jgi:hypothetical protein